MKFLRVGGLSPVKYKVYDAYESPPERRGIFAFIHPYRDAFLWGWKLEDKTEAESKAYYHRNRRVFDFKGELWARLIDPRVNQQIKGGWQRVHTETLARYVRMEKHDLLKALRAQSVKAGTGHEDSFSIDPYKVGLGGVYSVDWLEVFISGRDCSRIGK